MITAYEVSKNPGAVHCLGSICSRFADRGLADWAGSQRGNCSEASGPTQAGWGGLAGRGFAERGCPEHLIGGREARVAAGGVLGAVAGGVAAHHLGAGVAEQVLDVEFAGVLLDGPGREGMAKAVGVAAGHVGGASAAAEQLLEAVGLEPHAGPQLAGPGDGPRTAR